MHRPLQSAIAFALRRSEGKRQVDVADELGVSVACVNKWSQRFERNGLDGLQDLTGRGRPPSISMRRVEKVITQVTQPPKPRTRWSVRTMAREVGISPDSVHRIWRANDIKPHLVETDSPDRLLWAAKLTAARPAILKAVGKERVDSVCARFLEHMCRPQATVSPIVCTVTSSRPD